MVLKLLSVSRWQPVLKLSSGFQAKLKPRALQGKWLSQLALL